MSVEVIATRRPKHKWTLDIVVREFEFRDGRWVVISKRMIAANPDDRYRS